MDEKESLKLIQEFIEKLSKDFKIHTVLFFGSRAEGRAKEHSDIDLIVVSDDFEGMNFFRRVAKMYEYWHTTMPVDFLCFTIKEYNRLKKRISIVKEALQNGITIR